MKGCHTCSQTHGVTVFTSPQMSIPLLYDITACYQVIVGCDRGQIWSLENAVASDGTRAQPSR